jgi:hypothetical protein
MIDLDISWKDIDRLEERRKAGEKVHLKLRELAESCHVRSDAKYVGTVRRYDDTYMVYYYVYNGKKYIFAWVTPYDEIHRGYSPGTAPVWYDSITRGKKFTVRINSSNPGQHYITDKNFEEMNSWVYFLGTG